MISHKTLFILVISIITVSSVSAQEKLKIRINDSTWFEHEIILKKQDTINGKTIAVYASDTSVIAYEKSYYEGYQTGFYKIYFPSGKLMESSVYMKDKKNGDYTLYDIDGTISVKGEFVNDSKDGYWAFRKHKLYGKYKNGKKHGKWKWYAEEGIYYVYKFSNGNLLSVSPPGKAPQFPEYITND
jgi:antitoxin component YwqK of YwqJK toxin-antitoxin module